MPDLHGFPEFLYLTSVKDRMSECYDCTFIFYQYILLLSTVIFKLINKHDNCPSLASALYLRNAI